MFITCTTTGSMEVYSRPNVIYIMQHIKVQRRGLSARCVVNWNANTQQ